MRKLLCLWLPQTFTEAGAGGVTVALGQEPEVFAGMQEIGGCHPNPAGGRLLPPAELSTVALRLFVFGCASSLTPWAAGGHSGLRFHLV